MEPVKSDDGVSQVQAVVILVALTFILAALLLLMLHIPLWWGESNSMQPEVFAITELIHHCETGRLNYDSRITIRHTGTAVFRNDDLRAEIFVNDRNTGALIFTMNAHRFISTYHIGVQRLWGIGSTGFYWYPGELVYIDMTDGTFRPGDSVRLDVYDRESGSLISRSERTA
ncbi:MAG: hypothetical protein D5R99_09360 [Methanocalculus sp. MSAO_Arc1]|uniref:archaellin/type IV pilin N-terminal domain-containing protein n=1 Tax=Methanocalculus TaxID=71151 RepID=UPI000FF13753|nr:MULTISPECIES: archaellin/type IV pilin N-terminal domain-containing protein [unclassified Methanocalculus]MCP1662821.1 hypothetical protein [Methanocalculus sp. AMF5]RQD79013.1 MAG: hypothetical protein D5R99_09360 [Methanocalculus sp. MSAO_Arc1]